MRVDFAFRLICAVLICAVVMLITTLLGPARAVAAEPGMPPIDFLVYLDNSSTVFTGAPDAPTPTGEFAVTEVSAANARERILEEISRLQPAEVLLPEALQKDEEFVAAIRARARRRFPIPI